MAEPTPQKLGLFGRSIRTLGKMLGATDEVIGAGVSGLFAWFLYKTSGGKTLDSGNANSAPPVAPKQEDETRWILLLETFSSGGESGKFCAEILRAIHKKLININSTLAEQFRNHFFTLSGTPPSAIIAELRSLRKELKRIEKKPTDNEKKLFDALIENDCHPVIMARNIFNRIANDLQSYSSYPIEEAIDKAADKAVTIILGEGIIPGTPVANAELFLTEHANILSAWLKKDIARQEQRVILLEAERSRKRALSIKERLGEFGWWKIMIIVAAAMFLIITLLQAFTMKPQGHQPINPLQHYEDSASKGIADLLKPKEKEE